MSLSPALVPPQPPPSQLKLQKIAKGETEPHPRGGWVEAELCEDARLLGDDEFVSVEVQFRDETRSLSVRRRVVRFVGSASRTAVSSTRQPVGADLASLPRWVGNRSADGSVGQCLEAFLGEYANYVVRES